MYLCGVKVDLKLKIFIVCLMNMREQYCKQRVIEYKKQTNIFVGLGGGKKRIRSWKKPCIDLDNLYSSLKHASCVASKDPSLVKV